MVGNWLVTSDATGIPIDTLKHWKHTDWWKEAEAEIRASRNIKVSGNLSKIVEKAATHLEDRIENGDYLFQRDGTLTRKPLGGRELSEIVSKAIDKQVLLDKLITAPEIREEAVMDRLKSIEEALKRAVNITPRKPETIDVEEIADAGSFAELPASLGGNPNNLSKPWRHPDGDGTERSLTSEPSNHTSSLDRRDGIAVGTRSE